MSSRRLPAAILPVAVLMLALAVAPVGGESIWDRRQPDAAFLFTDNLASDVGDNLTVLIADESAFKFEGDRELEKTTSHTANLNLETIAGDVSIPAGSLEQSSSRTFEGSDAHTGAREFTDSITVTVRDRLPNGNLVVGGRKVRVIAGEEVVTTLTGIVAPEDVSAANTVSSTAVAYLSVHYEASGTSAAYIAEGWLNRLISFFWPF